MKNRCLTSTLVLTLTSASAASMQGGAIADPVSHNVPTELNWLNIQDQLRIKVRPAKDVVILDLDGKITLGKTSEALRANVKSLQKRGRKNILLNLAKIDSVDSSGVGTMVSIYTSLSRDGGRLKLLNVTTRIRDLLTITKLLTVFDVYEDEKEAVDSFDPIAPQTIKQKRASGTANRGSRTSGSQQPSAAAAVKDKVKQIIADELGVDMKEVTPQARFREDLGADSLDAVELVMRFEEEFGIEIPDEDAEKLLRVNDACDYIEKRTKFAGKKTP